MLSTVTMCLEKPIASVEILGNTGADAKAAKSEAEVPEANGEQAKLMQELEAQKVQVSQACQALKSVVDKLNEFYDKIFAEHKEKVAKLSVEIARKILMQKIQEGDYEIESIVKEALKNAPTRQDVVVHLNPEDLVRCQKVQADDVAGVLAGIKFVADSNIGRAECLLESPKGIIESLIDENLKRIGKALEKVE